jgi:hypothetical protein
MMRCVLFCVFLELTPEFFYNADFLDNVNGYDLGVKQDGQIVDDCALPTWAHESSAEFVRINRLALESEYVSENLHHWIDLIFGYKQRGQPAKEAHNLFFHLTYEGAVDVATIKDPVLLEAIKDQISQSGTKEDANGCQCCVPVRRETQCVLLFIFIFLV